MVRFQATILSFSVLVFSHASCLVHADLDGCLRALPEVFPLQQVGNWSPTCDVDNTVVAGFGIAA